jgi:GLPGLI family protein
MKKIILTFSIGMVAFSAYSQQKQGRVLYERTAQIEMHMMGAIANDEMAQMMPRSHKDKLEVLFNNDQSLRRAVEEEQPEVLSTASGEATMAVSFTVMGNSDVTYSNFTTQQVIAQREFGAKNYIVTDSLTKLNWKLTGKTSTILNYPCQQAVAQRIGKRTSTSIENGQLKNVEVADTANITAWFTPSIPVPAGPEFDGQLPGLILGIDINDGRIVYTATEISEKVELAAIKAPSKGKKVTNAAFNQERDKIMAEMNRNGGGMMRTRQ